MGQRSYFVVWGMVVLACAGCSRRSYTGPQRFPLHGQVRLDGQPVDWGSISFLPAAGGEQRVSGGLIENGAYAVPEEQGANVGQYRVEIHWLKKTGKQYRDRDSGEMVDERKEALPSQFHQQSKLTAEVASGQTTFDFHLKSQ
jgi:hypothetical protein